MTPFTRSVIIEPYHDCPFWIERQVTRREYVVLSSNSTEEDVELFLTLLFGYNNIDSRLPLEDAFKELLLEDEVAMSGGIAFFKSETEFILPSCCCGLEGIVDDVYQSVLNKKSPWLGHDPSPGITYHENNVKVWLDDPGSNENIDVFNIDFTYEELIHNIETSLIDLESFIDIPLYNWVHARDEEIGDQFRMRMKSWLGFKGA
ncbi:hypothetical protein GCM10023310_19770 [Paenibacillus vulneris]|uniref:Uncharacterized protein n=1 Tax=Paenibacillus vulneris TaxID=1133364 RepID=A0ABW3URU1_9BACL